MAENLGFTRELVEKALGEPIESLESSVGSEIGDGYACYMFKADVRTKKEPTKGRHIITKCYPESESRQVMLDHGNIFETELSMYDQVIPALNKMLETSKIPITLPFAPFIYGQYVPREKREELGRPLKPLDNCIIMPDMRHPSNGSFQLRDILKGFDLDHQALVVEGQATLHAVSWAYKFRKGLRNMNEEFPLLDNDLSVLWKSFLPMFTNNIKSIEEWLPHLAGSLEHLKKVHESIMGIYFGFDAGQAERGHTKDNILKNPGPVVENEEPWSVLLHGDIWNNNLMFRYDEKTNKPVEVIFIDLQLSKDGDLFNDLVGSLFMNAEAYLRKKHLASLLHVYFDRFTQICDSLSVPYLPNWTWEEFYRRYRRASIYGSFPTAAIPLMVKNPEALENYDDAMRKADLEDGSNSKEDPEKAMKKMTEFFGKVKKSDIHPSAFDRVESAFEEFVHDGVL